MLYTTHPTPLGDLLLAGPERGVLAWISMPGQKGGAVVGTGWRRDDEAFRDAQEQFDAYFAGDLKEFDLVHATAGTVFRERVWAALDEIPYGSTVSYGALADMAGVDRRAVRAVGGAVGSNPLTVVHPCHRVVGASGSLTGFAGGLDRKRTLLTLEGALPAPL
ncbi:methylated-DNA--[protein]-cysteine S-methyltransferase [Streptomyces sp. RKND-216]|uniref:methylated-DNA--[protein]-cysteine S-methyltransferase n=1 Tax=Streptomyces sp. RKND-216 TaxID=2562581 RepID=UPI00109DDD11|nr:methylated-DNA--[protein]-cysteine S-methyltransferase [Streptomyces sp. RKND-216]THA23859.1 methylated-DNA--[protein]-cysteine S-methyltransferase [Streptomyces sp. RKND-216]